MDLKSPFMFSWRHKTFVHRAHKQRPLNGVHRLVDGLAVGFSFSRIKQQNSTRLSSMCTASGNGFGTGRLVDAQCSSLINRRSVRQSKAKAKKIRITNHARLRVYRCVFRACGFSPAAVSKLAYLHPFTPRVLHYLWKQQYLPVRAQVAVGSLSAGVATAVDQVWRSASADDTTHSPGVVLIELKCYGQRLYRESGGRQLRPPFADIANSMYWHHQLQLAMTVFLFEKTFPSIPVQQAFVLRIDPQTISKYPLLPVTRARVAAWMQSRCTNQAEKKH